MSEHVLEDTADFTRRSSDLRVDENLGFRLKIAHYNPLVGGRHRDRPPFLANNKAIVNVHNRGNRCFGYDGLAALEESGHNPFLAHNYNQLLRVQGSDQLPYPLGIDNGPEFEDTVRANIKV